MIFYFSCISSPADANLLIEAGVRHILVDSVDLLKLAATAAAYDGRIALDSEAYRTFHGRS